MKVRRREKGIMKRGKKRESIDQQSAELSHIVHCSITAVHRDGSPVLAVQERAVLWVGMERHAAAIDAGHCRIDQQPQLLHLNRLGGLTDVAKDHNHVPRGATGLQPITKSHHSSQAYRNTR